MASASRMGGLPVCLNDDPNLHFIKFALFIMLATKMIDKSIEHSLLFGGQSLPLVLSTFAPGLHAIVLDTQESNIYKTILVFLFF